MKFDLMIISLLFDVLTLSPVICRYQHSWSILHSPTAFYPVICSATSAMADASRASILTHRKSFLKFQRTFIAIVVAPDPGS